MTMFVSFFVTRIVLKALGVENLGLINAIGGVASMFSFVSTTLSTACSRYFSYELGKGSRGRLAEMFSLMLLLYVIGGIVLVILMETFGGWYVLNKLVVPNGREFAAYMFFQLTIATWLAGWFAVPYSAVIVSYENMTMFAVFSIIDVILKLFVALTVLVVRNVDSLILYGWLLFAAALVHTGLHAMFVKARYPECRIRRYFNWSEMKEMLLFNGWQAFGALAWTTSDCFVNLLLNAFFGPVVNAARLVAYQLQGAVSNFTQGFLTASRPQIVKYWASGRKDEFNVLLKRSSKIGYFLTFFFAFPLFVEVDVVLKWWLDCPPEHAQSFTRIVLVQCLINTFSFPLVYGAQAVGKLALFTGVGSGVLLLTWPLSWFALTTGVAPEVVFLIATCVTLVAVVARAHILARLVNDSFWGFCEGVFGRMALFSVCSAVLPVLSHRYLPIGVCRFMCVGCASVISSVICFYYLGLDSSERRPVRELVFSYGSRVFGRA